MVREKAERLEMRVSVEFLGKIDDWRRKQPDLPSRAEAIRQLVELGLIRRPTRRAASVKNPRR